VQVLGGVTHAPAWHTCPALHCAFDVHPDGGVTHAPAWHTCPAAHCAFDVHPLGAVTHAPERHTSPRAQSASTTQPGGGVETLGTKLALNEPVTRWPVVAPADVSVTTPVRATSVTEPVETSNNTAVRLRPLSVFAPSVQGESEMSASARPVGLWKLPMTTRRSVPSVNAMLAGPPVAGGDTETVNVPVPTGLPAQVDGSTRGASNCAIAATLMAGELSAAAFLGARGTCRFSRGPDSAHPTSVSSPTTHHAIACAARGGHAVRFVM
jgi:hypothetical protein